MAKLSANCARTVLFQNCIKNIKLGYVTSTIAMVDLIVKSAVKEALGEKNVSSDFYEALDEEVLEVLEDAGERAEANDRKTVQKRDL